METLGPMKCVLIREVSSFQGANNTYPGIYMKLGLGQVSCMIRKMSLIREVSFKEGFHCIVTTTLPNLIPL